MKPGNSQSLWKAAKIAKDVNITTLLKILFQEGIAIPSNDLPDRFANHFDNKSKLSLMKSQ
jgi:hypothetical protein